eukprot:494702-Prorocentrum_minimum.AAC.2
MTTPMVGLACAGMRGARALHPSDALLERRDLPQFLRAFLPDATEVEGRYFAAMLSLGLRGDHRTPVSRDEIQAEAAACCRAEGFALSTFAAPAHLEGGAAWKGALAAYLTKNHAAVRGL